MTVRKLLSALLALLLTVSSLIGFGVTSASAEEAPAFSVGSITEKEDGGFAVGSDGFSLFLSSRKGSAYATHDLRFVLVANLEKLCSYGNASLTVTFLKGADTVKVLKKKVMTDLVLYRSATAAGNLYTAAEGSVLFGTVITEIPRNEWTEVSVSLDDADQSPLCVGNETAEKIAPLTYDGSTWMSAIPDSVSLGNIAIPGTHDSGATKDFLLPGTAKCQNLSIAEQLAAGVRYFDIRLRREKGELKVYHGFVDQKLSFDEVLDAFYTFIDANGSETLIVCIKEETDATGTNDAFDVMVKNKISENPSKWYLNSGIPKLGQVRGKLVLMRRFSTSGTYGFNATNGWTDNDTFTLQAGGATLKCQDYYKNDSREAKWTAVSDFFEVMTPASNTYYLNNTSGGVGVAGINTVANYVNPLLIAYLSESPEIVGIIATDLMTEEIGALIYGLNFS